MKTSLRSIFLGLLLAVATALPAPAQEYLDATHLFEEETRRLAETETKETLAEFDLRTRGQVQEADRRPPMVGDVIPFNCINLANNQPMRLNAVLKKIGKHCYIYLEQGRNIDSATITQIAEQFDNRIYPTTTSHFGTEWNPGIDGDPRITIFLLDIRDRYDPANKQYNFTGGYFYSGNEYPVSKSANSNQREMLYMDIYPSKPGSKDFLSTLAHEFQHMIHWHHDPKEAQWFNESMSQYASFVNGYGHPSQLLFFYRNPDNNLLAWAPETMVTNYGQTYLMGYFMATHLAKTAADQKSLTRALVEENADGSLGIERVFKRKGIKLTFGQVFSAFSVANYVNESGFANGLYGYGNVFPNMRLPLFKSHESLPASGRGTIKPWSARAVRVALKNTRGPISIGFGGGRQFAKTSQSSQNSFDVAAVLTSKNQPPKLEWLPVRNYQSQATLKTPADGYDSLLLVFVHKGPTGKIETTFAQKAPTVEFGYSVGTTKAPVVARSSGSSRSRSGRRLDRSVMRSMMEAQIDRAEPRFASPSASDTFSATVESVVIPHELDQMNAEDEQIVDSLRDFLESGDTSPLDDFLAVYAQANPQGKANLGSLRAKIIDLLSFEVSQNDHAELTPYLERFRNS